MGSSTMHKPVGMPPAEFLINHSGMLKWTDESIHRRRVLDHALVKLHTLYVAVESITVATGEREVTAYVFLVQNLKGEGRYRDNNFLVKGLHEYMGPCEAECPQRILDLLTPTTGANAQEWRQACRATIARAEQAKTIEAGMDISLYGKAYHVEARIGAKGVRVTAAETGQVYRINLVQLKQAIILSPAPVSMVEPLDAALAVQQEIAFEEEDAPAETMGM